MLDDDLIDGMESDEGAESIDMVNVAAFGSSKEFTALTQKLQADFPYLQINVQTWSDGLDLSASSIFVVELQEEFFFEDIDIVRKLRVERPLSPIIATSEQLRSGLITVAFESGLSDYILPGTPPAIMGPKLKAAYKVSKTSILVEIQNNELVESTRSLRAAYSKLKEEVEARKTAENERDIAQQVAELHEQNKEILDNLLSGFFTIEKSLVVAETTSKACEDLFFNQIAGKPVTEALDVNETNATFLRLALEQVFDNIMPMDVSLSFVPQKIETKHSKIIDLHFTPVMDENNKPLKIIVVATDITEQVAETKKLKQQEKTNQIIINILHHDQTFKLFLKNYKSSLQVLKTSSDQNEAKRILHTLKGNSLTFGFEHIGERIHDMETELNDKSEFDFDTCRNQYSPELERLMIEFLEANSSVLGIDYHQSQEIGFSFSEEQIKKFYGFAEEIEQEDKRADFLALVNLHKMSPASVFTEVLSLKVNDIIKKLEKSIDFNIKGDDVLVDRDRLQGVFDNLIHGLTNACSHGIEPEKERIEKKKPGKGRVQLSFVKKSNDLLISIFDDGAGINKNKVVKSAVKNNIIKEEDVPKLKQEEIFSLIFVDSLSTADQINEISGRGVGMPALKSAIKAVNGKIKIKSLENQGTNIIIFLPNGCVFSDKPMVNSVA